MENERCKSTMHITPLQVSVALLQSAVLWSDGEGGDICMSCTLRFRKYVFIFRRPRLYDADVVGDIEGIGIGTETDVSLFLSIRPYQGIDLDDLHVVQRIDGLLNLPLVR
jgi:hypothetical protein